MHRAHALAIVVSVGRSLHAQPAAVADSFRLYKFEQPIGWEVDRVTQEDGAVVRAMDFAFTDRGRRVPLAATLRTAPNGDPRHFELKGNTSRFTRVDDAVDVDPTTHHARLRVDSTSRDTTLGAAAFPIVGYAPVGAQEAMLRWWDAHGRPRAFATLPNGTVRVEARGVDTVSSGGRTVALRRFGVGGLIWGRETAWLDPAGRLAALVTNDAEFDHFEAARPEYADALPRFVARAAEDAARALRQMSPAAPSGTFALVGGTVIDATGAPPVPDAVVVVRDGRIAAVGPRARVPVPNGVAVVDARGKWVTPGLWDMHAHYEQVEWGPIYLGTGVTTARDVGNEFDFIAAVRRVLDAGEGVGPRLLLAGVIDGRGPYALGIQQAATPAEGEAFVDRYHDAHFDQIKIYSSLSAPVLAAVTRRAHAFGMTVTGHVPNGIATLAAVDSGMDQINHVEYLAPLMRGRVVGPNGTDSVPLFAPDSAWSRAAIAHLVAHHTVVDPTLALFEWALHPAREPFARTEPGVTHVAPELRAPLEHSGVPAAREASAAEQMRQFVETVRALHAAGVPIVAGTDQTVPGYSLHRELELYVRAGFTPLEALQAATVVPARVMGRDGDVGTVTAGKRADLLVVDADPLADVANLRRISLVIANGRRYDPAVLLRNVGFIP